MQRFFLILLLILSPVAVAKTTLDVETGYGGRFRAGRWSPVFVTVQSDQPRDADVELHVANASSSVMSIRQTIGVGPAKQTYVLYAPLSMMDDPARVTLYDRDSGKTLAHWPDEGAAGNQRFGLGAEQIGFMAVTSGRSPMMAGFTRSNVTGPTIVTHLKPSLLPITPAGYDPLDLLVLNHPDLEAITVEQQQAIVAWVRSGGTLLIWPGPDPLAPGPLADALPVTLGDNGTLQLSAGVRRAAKLGDRFATIGTRTLVPRGKTADLPMLSHSTSAVAGALGLGRIVVLPIDASTLQFGAGGDANNFWNALLDPLYNVSRGQQQANAYYENNDINASQLALDRIGQIPGTGQFGFSYVLMMVGAMMLLVGPVDYLVLKKLGRQPWTWTTTAGWIGLFTVGALLAGRFLQNGDLHFRTLQIIEQAGNRVIGSDEVALVYAPRSATYAVNAPPTSWWQPVPSGYRFSSNGFSLPLDLAQDYRGTTPSSMWIDVWNFRFLQGRTYADAPPWVEASLAMENGHLRGTLKNGTTANLSGVSVKIEGYQPTPGKEIPAGGSIDLDLKLAKSPKSDANQSANNMGYVNGQYMSVPNADFFNIDPARADAATRPPLPGMAATAMISANADDVTPDLSILNPKAIQSHSAVYRAVVELGETK